MKWRDIRFHFFDRNPHVFSAFEASLDELQTTVFEFSQRRKYDLTRHALGELRELLSSYLQTRDQSLRVPTSTMAMFFPSETTFDPLLTHQLEHFKAHAARGISNSDQEFVKQVVSTLAGLSISASRSRSYFTEHSESSVATFVCAYLTGAIRDAAIRGLDDVALEGADHLRDLCRALIDGKHWISALTPIGDLEQLANVAILGQKDVVLVVVVRALSDCLLHNCVRGIAGTHISDHILESLFRISRARLASPLGLEGMKVSYSIGPFISPTERSSFAAINIALVNALAELSRTDQRDSLGRLRGVYEEVHDKAWLNFAKLGVEAVKKNSFLLHFLNSTIEETVKANLWLFGALDLPRVIASDSEAAHEQYLRKQFRDEIREKARWETTGIYSRIVVAMFEQKHLSQLGDTLKLQSQFAFWAMRVHLEEIAVECIDRVFKACSRLVDPEYKDVYGAARLSIHVAEIGIYALALGAGAVFKTATDQYSVLRRNFAERHPDEHFVGDFESAERKLLEEKNEGGIGPLVDPHDREFFSTITSEHIQQFFAALS